MREKFKYGMKYIIGALLGGLAGYLYYYFVGCVSGACPISSNAYVSTIYCAIIGVLLVSAFFSKRKPAKQREQS